MYYDEIFTGISNNLIYKRSKPWEKIFNKIVHEVDNNDIDR